MYGKTESKPKRKLGHFNVMAKNDNEDISSLLDKVKKLKNSVIIVPAN